MNNEELLTAWQKAKSDLDDAKSEELKLRNLLVAEAQKQDPSKTEGTTKLAFGELGELNVSLKTRRTIDSDMFAIAYEMLSEEEKKVFTMKPTINTKKYREQEDNPKIARMITVSPAQASIKLISPEVEI